LMRVSSFVSHALFPPSTQSEHSRSSSPVSAVGSRERRSERAAIGRRRRLCFFSHSPSPACSPQSFVDSRAAKTPPFRAVSPPLFSVSPHLRPSLSTPKPSKNQPPVLAPSQGGFSGHVQARGSRCARRIGQRARARHVPRAVVSLGFTETDGQGPCEDSRLGRGRVRAPEVLRRARYWEREGEDEAFCVCFWCFFCALRAQRSRTPSRLSF